MPCGQAVVMTAPPKVICINMYLQTMIKTELTVHTHTHHHASSQDVVGSLQGDLSVNNVTLCLSLCIGLDIAKVSGMSILISWSTMVLLEGVEVRASARTACSVVSKLVDMEAVFAWSEATHFTSHPGHAISLKNKGGMWYVYLQHSIIALVD